EGGPPNTQAAGAAGLKERLLEEIRKQKKFFHGTVVAQAQRIDFEGDAVVFVFGPQHRALRTQLEQNRPWLEATASQLAGRRIAVVAADGSSSPSSPGSNSASGGPPSLSGGAAPPRPAGFGGTAGAENAPAGGAQKEALKQRALSDAGVQTMLD